jgi:LacI family transcriptional regulator, galactose operon repressor
MLNARKKVTIREIAEVANVSLSTVSRALRGDPRAKRGTVERVLQVARDLNYYPDSLAKSLRQSRTNTIGIIFNDLNNPFYSEILGVIGATLNNSSYSMIISYSHYDAAQERANIMSMLSKRVDGIILSPINDQTENVRLLEENGVEYVLIDCFPRFPGTSYVYSDHGMGARIATEHLISRGHRDILLLTGPPSRCMHGAFIDNYKKALEENGIAVRPALVVHAEDLSIESGYQSFKRLLAGSAESPNLEFSAVVTISDLLAIGIYKLANELKFRIPDDYSVVGYDNIEIASVLSPPLTTIHQPRKRIGLESLRMLLHNIEHEEKERKAVALPPHLVKRGSVRSLG